MSRASFRDYPLTEELFKAIDLLGYKTPTKVQEQVIPAILAANDIIIKSQTGSGKTAAFAIPICQLVDWQENKPQALVLTPTRELAIQVREDCFHLGRLKKIKVAAVYGQSPFHLQKKELKQKTHIVVGTPGRIIDHLERGTLETARIRYLVIDEADEMLRMGFVEQVEMIIKALPADRVTIVLSATMPSDISALCAQHMKHPVYVAIEEEDPVAARISQTCIAIADSQKLPLLKDLLMVENPNSCIIFCNTQLQVDAVSRELRKENFPCAKIHGGMEQPDRLRVMADFRGGLFRYLVATDVAARGIDIEQIGLVINYDVPNSGESYVHRIGRTGRIGNLGRAITFVTPADEQLLREIQRYIGSEIPLAVQPTPGTVSDAAEEFMIKSNQSPERKEGKGAKLSEGIIKLHINAGKKTKMRAVDIVGTLCSIPGITTADIGIINIMDVSTFVEILNHKGEMVLEELQRKPIKGRLRKVSLVVC